MTENYEEAPAWAQALIEKLEEIKVLITPQEDRFKDFRERINERYNLKKQQGNDQV